jgi:hypothetical protein
MGGKEVQAKIAAERRGSIGFRSCEADGARGSSCLHKKKIMRSQDGLGVLIWKAIRGTALLVPSHSHSSYSLPASSAVAVEALLSMGSLAASKHFGTPPSILIAMTFTSAGSPQ